MRPRIAIPVPHSFKPDYVQRSLPQYERAIEQAGGEPVRIPLDREPDEVAKVLNTCDAVLLPGSPADIDPQKYEQPRDPHTAAADPKRDMVDELLLQDAYNMHKPILGICYGLQALNVWRTGTLLQHIDSPVKHEAGREVLRAHAIRVDPVSRLAGILTHGTTASHGDSGRTSAAVGNEAHAETAAAVATGVAAGVATEALKPIEVETNSSHHQAADVVGDGLRVAARSAEDNVIEALEGTAPEHFVLAVQWHPERMVEQDESSRSLFRALVDEARRWREAQAVGS
jgi:putative glutamine amidotransferase